MPNPVITAYGPGESPAVWRPGDVILTRNLARWWTKAGFVSGAIRFGERLHLHGAARQYARWNHAVCVSGGPVAPAGLSGNVWLVEALGHGVQRSPLDTYKPVEYLYVATDLDDSERTDFVGYVESMVGTAYGFATIAGIALKMLTGLRVEVGPSEPVICSGLACSALGIYKWRSNPSMVTPSDLCAYHNVRDF